MRTLKSFLKTMRGMLFPRTTGIQQLRVPVEYAREGEEEREEGCCGPAIARAPPSFFNCLARSCFFSIRVLLRYRLLSRFSLFATMSFFVRTVALAASRRSLLSQNNVIPVRASHVSDTSLSLSALKNFVSEATATGSTTTSTDARFYSSIRDVRRLHVLSSSTDRALLNASEFGNNRSSGRRGGEIWSLSVRSQSRSNSVPFAEEIPALSQQVGTRSEHSAALVEEERENEAIMDEFVEVGHKLANAAGAIIMNYFRSRFQIIDKEDSSPVTIADRAAEEAMCSILAERFPTHAIFGEEGGLKMPKGGSDYCWVLDPIDGTKSFITGKPVFGTLIALVYKGVPVFGIIDQPVLGERWVGIQGQVSMLNGDAIQTRASCDLLKNAYLYTTSPHMFSGESELAFSRARNKVKVPLYGCDCYAYGLLAAGHVDLVIERGLKPYDYLALVPIVEGAGGVMTNWNGQPLRWWPELGEVNIEVLAAGNETLHKAALSALAWS